ncbi:MAG: RNA methyltransferase [Eubacterium sp.]|nr:RNA methyltransferase [Eubacterium sp.]
MNPVKITDLHCEQTSCYVELSENQLKHFYEPEEGVFIAESEKVIRRALDGGYQPLSFLVSEDRLKTLDPGLFGEGVPVYSAAESLLHDMLGYELTGGLLSLMRRRRMPDVAGIVSGARRVVVICDVQNPTNVGAIFRNAAGLGMDAVIVTKGSCDPLYRRSARVSMGTVFQIPWTYGGDGWISALKDGGFKLAAMALEERSVELGDPAVSSQERLAVVLGNEGYGLPAQTVAQCDYCVRIPMSHGVDSLNVAAASAVAFWELQ